jgi:hypothetical protein
VEANTNIITSHPSICINFEAVAVCGELSDNPHLKQQLFYKNPVF